MPLACRAYKLKIGPMRKTINLLKLLQLLPFLLPIFLYGCSSDEIQQRPNKPIVALKVFTTTLHDRTDALGTAGANESIDITAKVSGRLDEVLFTDGQKVRKGDVIVKLDQSEEQAQLTSAKAQLAEHQREIQRLELLLQNRAAATRDLDERKTLADMAAGTVTEIESRISELTLRAPFNGTLGIRRISPGSLVQSGQIITTLDADDPIKLDFSIPATSMRDIKAKAPIIAEVDTNASLHFKGTISALDSRIDPVTRSVLARAIIPNPEGKLIPGMLMRITILQNERRALIVPEESITQKQEKHFVTVIDGESKASIKAVVIGTRHDGIVEIREGLSEGDLVVVRGMGFIKPGQTVTISETWDTIRNSQFLLGNE